MIDTSDVHHGEPFDSDGDNDFFTTRFTVHICHYRQQATGTPFA